MLASFRDVTFEWPNGQIVFQWISFVLEKKKYGLVGPNGVGKSTLARLLTGELKDFTGTLRTDKNLVFFRQNESAPECTVAEFVAEVWDNPEAIELLRGIDLERPCTLLSGGQWTRVRLAKAFAVARPFLILDEPTNHLDREGRERIIDFVRSYDAGLLLISHDRELLREVDETLELSSKGLQKFGGNWDFYEAERAAERRRALEALNSAKIARDRAHDERADRAVARERQNRHGKINAEKKGLPKIILGAMKRRAEVTTGKLNVQSQDKLNEAVADAFAAAENLKIESVLHPERPRIEIPENEILLFLEDFTYGFPNSLWAEPLSLTLRGPRKIAITGPNGAGKSTLLRLLAGHPLGGTAAGTLRLSPKPKALVTQSLSDLNESRSVLDHVREVSAMSEAELRKALARFLFRGNRVFSPLSELSGGERLRVVLAQALLRSEPAALLLLDEPTNHLDLSNIEFLETFLSSYPGAVIMASHDRDFLKRSGIEAEIPLKK